MVELPTGTVTLLFSDMEGSTQLLSKLGSSYVSVLDAQREELRRAWGKHGGVELGTEGDSFYVVFETAELAVAAAVQAQRSLASRVWPAGEQVRVRIGVHTGSPEPHGDAYVGMDVHRAARIAASAHGGQVLVSAATAELVAHHLPDDLSLRDLGRHRLKDIPAPERLIQVDAEGLPSEFPAPRTLGAATTLPAPSTATIGRAEELADLAGLLDDPTCRLVTLTGPGGSGKTRLAVELARQLSVSFTDGVFLVPLAAVTDAVAMWMAIGEALGLTRQVTRQSVVAELSAGRKLLLVDNLEQLPSAGAVVSELLAETPELVIVATSRMPLHVAAEHEYPVPPLQLPATDSLADVAASSAAQLFALRASAVRPGFKIDSSNAADVAALCRRLDGLPLAIEIAGARSKLLTPSALLSRIGTVLDIASPNEDQPQRQHTLRHTIDWSYNLLTPDQQGFFRRLGVFARCGATLDAVGAVNQLEPESPALLDLVSYLLDASLVRICSGEEAEPRIELLETVRDYALGKLRANHEFDDIARAHAVHYLELAEALTEPFLGSKFLEAYEQYETESDNIRAALTWCTTSQDPATRDRSPSATEIAMRFCLAMGWYWEASDVGEARPWLETVVNQAAGHDCPLLAEAISELAVCLSLVGEYDDALDLATAAIDMWERMGHQDPVWSYFILGLTYYNSGETELGLELLNDAEVRVRKTTDRSKVMVVKLVVVLKTLGTIEGRRGEEARSAELLDEARSLAVALGDRVVPLDIDTGEALRLMEAGHVVEAKSRFRSLIPRHLAIHYRDGLVDIADLYGIALTRVGEYETASALILASRAARTRSGLQVHRDMATDLEAAASECEQAISTAAWLAIQDEVCDASLADVLAESYEKS